MPSCAKPARCFDTSCAKSARCFVQVQQMIDAILRR
jgi:hypothetical protein